MEIKITAENIVRILWIVSVVFSGLGFLMLLAGVIGIFNADDLDDVFRYTGLVAGGIAFAVIPASLANSVAHML